MAYQLEEITLEEAYRQAENLEYALLYRISDRILCKSKELTQDSWKECIEARIFSETKEIHIFEQESKKAVVITELDTKDVISKQYQLENGYSKYGDTLCVQQYLGFDEDGQAYIEMTRLKGIK